jgi:hypothetical protein
MEEQVLVMEEKAQEVEYISTSNLGLRPRDRMQAIMLFSILCRVRDFIIIQIQP